MRNVKMNIDLGVTSDADVRKSVEIAIRIDNLELEQLTVDGNEALVMAALTELISNIAKVRELDAQDMLSEISEVLKKAENYPSMSAAQAKKEGYNPSKGGGGSVH